MVDVKSGLTSSDHDVAAMLKKSGKPIVLVCNKVDNVGDVPMAFYEFYNLGMDEPLAISSVHGLGTGDLLDKLFEYVPESDEIEEDEALVFVIDEYEDESALVIVDDDRLIDIVFKEYYEMLEEAGAL